MPNLGRNPTTLLIAAWSAVLALTIAIYCLGLPGYWVFDDFTNIANNDAMSYPLDWQHFSAILAAGSGYLRRPLSTLSFYLDSHFFGLTPAAFKLTNIGIHVITGLCLGAMARGLLRLYRTRRQPDLSDAKIDWLTFITAAIWLVHPLNLTAVLYVVQRDTELSALFTAVAVWAYIRGRELQFAGNSRASYFFWIWVPLLTVLGIACKENAALTPVFLFVIEFTLFGFKGRAEAKNRELQAFFALFLFLPACVAIILMLRGNNALMGGYVIRDFTLVERLMTECRVLLLYLRWTLLPEPQRLGLYHDDIAASHGLMSPASTLPSILGVLALLVAALLLRRRNTLISLGILWFFAGHLIESTVLPLELVFEHRNYLPLFGLILGIVGAIGCSDYARQHVRSLAFVAVLLVASFSALTALRSLEWSSPPEFAESEVRHHPDSPRAQYQLGSVLIAIAMDGQTQFSRPAVDAMLRSRALDRNSISEDIALALLFTATKQPAEVTAYLDDAARRGATIIPNVETQSSLQSVIRYGRSNQGPPFEEMDRVYASVLANPRTSDNPCFAAGIWNTYGVYLQDNDRIPQSMSALHRALTLCPTLTDIRVNYARNLISYGDFADARAQIALIERVNSLGHYNPQLEELRKDLATEESLLSAPRK